VNEVRDAFSDLVLGGRCAGCGRPGRVLCSTCSAALPQSGHGVRPDPSPSGLPPVFSAGDYADPLRRLILTHKEHQAFALADPLGLVLASVLAGAVDQVAPGIRAPLVLVPVPSAPSATRTRGHDPVLRMTRVAARALTAHGRHAQVARLLRIAQPVADQAGLGAAARTVNLSGHLAVRARGQRALARGGAPVLLVLCDDVLTTGATLAEAQRALSAVGLPAAVAATVAATRRRVPERANSPGFGRSLPLS